MYSKTDACTRSNNLPIRNIPYDPSGKSNIKEIEVYLVVFFSNVYSEFEKLTKDFE